MWYIQKLWKSTEEASGQENSPSKQDKSASRIHSVRTQAYKDAHYRKKSTPA
jgi:hypothetical protein